LDLLRTLLLHTVTIHTTVALSAIYEGRLLWLRFAGPLLGTLVDTDGIGALRVAVLDDLPARIGPDRLRIRTHHLLCLLDASDADERE